MEFNFSNLSDLSLNNLEERSINIMFPKLKVNQAYWQETAQEFMENYVRCLKSAVPCNAVPSVVAAQGILESGWGSTNSLFGVKATLLQTKEHIGVVAQTHEVVGAISIPAVGDFFETPSIQNNFANYYDYVARMKPFSKNFMPNLWSRYLDYLQQELAYSTAGQAYINSVTEVIIDNGLTAFDHN